MIPHSEEKAKVTAEIITPPTVHRSPVHLVIHLNLLPDTCDIVSFKTENRGSQTFEPPVGVDLDYITRPAGEGKRLPTSTPSSPLLKAKPWSSASPSPSVKSRLWVEAALQRSKNIQLKHQSAQWMKEQPGDIENQLSTTGIRAQYCELVPCICHRYHISSVSTHCPEWWRCKQTYVSCLQVSECPTIWRFLGWKISVWTVPKSESMEDQSWCPGKEKIRENEQNSS